MLLSFCTSGKTEAHSRYALDNQGETCVIPSVPGHNSVIQAVICHPSDYSVIPALKGSHSVVLVVSIHCVIPAVAGHQSVIQTVVSHHGVIPGAWSEASS